MSDEGRGDPRERLHSLGLEIREAYAKNKRVMSFDEYFTLFSAQPARQVRSAAQYLRDVFDHFGTEEVRDAARADDALEAVRLPVGRRRDALIGQEEVQARVYRVLVELRARGAHQPAHPAARAERPRQVDLRRLHARALEHYSTLDEGALYRFNWIFPSQKLTKGGIGFGGGDFEPARRRGETFAYLDDELIDAKLVDEMRDHPLLLLPPQAAARAARASGSADRAELRPADYLLRGDLVAQEPADLRGAAVVVPRRLLQGAAPRAGRALLRLAPLPRRRRPPSSRSWRSTRARAS